MSFANVSFGSGGRTQIDANLEAHKMLAEQKWLKAEKILAEEKYLEAERLFGEERYLEAEQKRSEAQKIFADARYLEVEKIFAEEKYLEAEQKWLKAERLIGEKTFRDRNWNWGSIVLGVLVSFLVKILLEHFAETIRIFRTMKRFGMVIFASVFVILFMINPEENQFSESDLLGVFLPLPSLSSSLDFFNPQYFIFGNFLTIFFLGLIWLRRDKDCVRRETRLKTELNDIYQDRGSKIPMPINKESKHTLNRKHKTPI